MHLISSPNLAISQIFPCFDSQFEKGYLHPILTTSREFRIQENSKNLEFKDLIRNKTIKQRLSPSRNYILKNPLPHMPITSLNI